jgi:ribosomal protein S27AE
MSPPKWGCAQSGQKSSRGTMLALFLRVPTFEPRSGIMHIEMCCPECGWQAHKMPQEQALERIASEGPWYALGDGETFEDRIAILAEQNQECPRCGTEAVVSADSLCRLSLLMLANW